MSLKPFNVKSGLSVGADTAITVIDANANANVADLHVSGNVTSNLLPNANITYNLGSSTQRWNDIWLANSTIHIGAQTISSTANGVIISGDTTVTTLSAGVSGNIIVSGNLIPNITGQTLGTSSLPWSDAYFGPNSITILDETGNVANTVILQNSGGNTIVSSGGFVVAYQGNSVFQVQAQTGQLISNAKTIISNATNSTDTVTGSLQTAGGAGIAKDLYVGGNVTATYYHGDGSFLTGLAPSLQSYLFANTVSDISDYYAMVSYSQFTPGAVATVSRSVTTSETLLQAFATPVGLPGLTIIPPGTFQFNYETQRPAGGTSATYYTYAKLYKRTVAGVETLLVTSDNTTALSIQTVIQQTATAYNGVNISLSSTDRIVVKMYAIASSTQNISIKWDDNTLSGFIMPAPNPTVASYIPYTGSTANVTLGTWSLSAANLTVTGNATVGTLKANATGNITITGNNLNFSGNIVGSTIDGGSA